MRERARRRLPRGIFEFVDRGTEDETAARRMREAFDRIELLPRVMVDISRRSLSTELFGVPVRSPLVVAPTGAAGLLWHDGELAIAKAARKLGIPFTLSTASINSLEAVAEKAGGRLWFQLYMWPDREMSYQLVDRVARAGYEALVVTVDTAVTPNREYNLRNGFGMPVRFNRRNIVDVMRRPGWLVQVLGKYLLTTGVPRFENFPDALRRSLFAGSGPQAPLPKNDSLGWDDLRALRSRWKGPLVVKGVLRPEDAVEAVNNGADSVIVSSHGGRNLDHAVAPIKALPRVIDAIGSRVPVMFDSGIRRGSDAVKALALGAACVLVGRSVLWGVAAGGQAGAERSLSLMNAEIERVLGFLGCSSPKELGRDHLWIGD
jgi:isopentenyl diphosphate isomerase/L-lactate dehydrogenase-like FMN-dependent dehydrogenase